MHPMPQFAGVAYPRIIFSEDQPVEVPGAKLTDGTVPPVPTPRDASK